MKPSERLDRIFSEYIRRRDADDRGLVKCCTCPVVLPWKEIQAGHYIGRGNMATRWNEMNAHGQCMKCNQFNHGMPEQYDLFMFANYDWGKVEELRALSRTAIKFMPHEINEMIEQYMGKIKAL